VKLYKIGQAAKLIKKSDSTLRRWEKEEKLKANYVSEGGHRYYSEEQIIDFVKNNEEKKVVYKNLSNYQKGIFWSIGSYIPSDEAMVFKSKSFHHIKELQEITPCNKIGQLTVKGKPQYVLKSYMYNMEDFKENKWTRRNGEFRYLPVLSCYRDFLRAYIELHSCLDYSIRKKKQKKLRLRIFGNENIIREINVKLAQFGVKEKTPQTSYNAKTYILYCTALQEIQLIFNTIYDNENYCPVFWEKVDTLMRKPILKQK